VNVHLIMGLICVDCMCVVGKMHLCGIYLTSGMTRDAIGSPVFYPWDMDHAEAIAECLLFEIPESWVGYLVEASVTEEFQKGLVIDGDNQVLAT
jgi:hypothetical protein